ncbi:facilitated trehalose transporter Tret1-like [Galleria mellonella]|uniref:Facilitated trehalose transporter Tret1-like n=1 Tax=Galleria mellonella TaxID=7137 RepID=A0A6J1WHT1_GALME|nr:facilitated trehalose transporter Tret1-like [Galleria mellonella]
MKKYNFFFSEGSKVNQLICVVLINIPVFAYGTTIGWMSPMSLLLQSKDSPRQPPLTDIEISWIGSVPYLVCMMTDFLIGYIGDKIGRKVTMIFVSAMAAGCWIVKLSSTEFWAFVLARCMVGFPMAGAYVTCPLYTKEISEDSIRGSLGSLVILFHTTGNLFIYIIGDVFSYTTVLWICLALPTIHIVLFMMMPESPSYLVKRGKIQEAERVLAWLRCREEGDIIIKQELERIRQELKKDEESSKFVLKAILTDKILCRTFRIVMVICLGREICGAVPVLNFAGNIFAMASEGTGLVLTPNQQAMVLGAVQVAGSSFASSIVERSGRKPLLFITSLVSGLSMCTLASWFVARNFGLLAPAWLPVVTLCVCIFCDASGLQPISVILNGEMFSFKYRGTVMAATMASASIVAFLQMLFFKPLANSMGVHVAFYFFGIICLIAAVYVILVLPETRMRSVQEIQNKLKTKKEKEEEEGRVLEEKGVTKEIC